MKIKIYYKIRTLNDDGHYGEDNPESDYPNEVYFPPTASSYIQMMEYEFKEIKKAFDSEDADYDYSRNIVYITNEKGKIIFDSTSRHNAQNQKRLLEIAEVPE